MEDFNKQYDRKINAKGIFFKVQYKHDKVQVDDQRPEDILSYGGLEGANFEVKVTRTLLKILNFEDIT